jgi:hypothetical protein
VGAFALAAYALDQQIVAQTLIILGVMQLLGFSLAETSKAITRNLIGPRLARVKKYFAQKG